ncbi:hypothetical protein DESUT3_03120 [Desulfuromonas versatilis]|uniref:Uncharacterized protein n=1 Tax=Desulfuromonas versatilis TaxID=2802975 RepID=A0ABM8HNV2_9BACT|nr:hypothetical protein [Desulfuromonas versatilis]BCR03243.1 hypothetical protein DESUT3_03120 [Desulfuromonas versatilis]
MFLRWFPWKQLVSRMAKSRGMVDPVGLLSRLESFGQPIEVREPLELLRAGVVFHARGLLNTSAIQHNLDWIWPYWVERQYDPLDPSFIPRAFSITHINLTHRNWTAIGTPDEDQLPIVDPRGLLTPFYDGWSLDYWLVRNGGTWLVPSQLERVEQRLELLRGLAVVTTARQQDQELSARASVELESGAPVCRLELAARSLEPAWLVVSLRPYNPEGISFVHRIEAENGLGGWRIERQRSIHFDPPAQSFRFSDYHQGDVHTRLFHNDPAQAISCKVGMATAAALYPVDGSGTRVRVDIPLETRSRFGRRAARRPPWAEALAGGATARLPDPRFQMLFDAAVRSLLLHSPGEVYPGPYTYKRFWFRDAAFILHGLLCLGFRQRVERVLDSFPARQTAAGFFFSQEGEWDSNGEALWIMDRFCLLTGRRAKEEWVQAIQRGARWIQRKRLPEGGDPRYAGLLPPGFSAEHLGPNDYYYWDDFWGVAGLRAAAELLESRQQSTLAAELLDEADRFEAAIARSLELAAERLGCPGMPASPTRRLDCGAIGSLAAGYPLQLFEPHDPRLLATVEFLLQRSLVGGGFFQDVIHSGINPYLTLHLAQVLLRAGDPRALELFRTVAELASPTGQWPEAVHPRTGGGCMGDGHHVWAAAEWILMQRNAFFREEGGALILGSGIFPEWLEQEDSIAFGPGPTAFGPITLTIRPRGDLIRVQWDAEWRRPPEAIEVRLPGHPPVVVGPEVFTIDLQRAAP